MNPNNNTSYDQESWNKKSRLYNFWKQYTWPKKLLVFLIVLFFVLYYPIGMFWSNTIDIRDKVLIKNMQPPYAPHIAGNVILEQLKDGWSPGKPWYFPSHFLENMPAYQIGVVETISGFSTLLYSTLGRPSDTAVHDVDLTISYEAFQYPSNIWLLGSGKVLSQDSYKNGAIALIRYSHAVSNNVATYHVNKKALIYFLKFVQQTLQLSIQQQRQILLNATIFSNDVDMNFYKTKGHMFVLYVISQGYFRDTATLIQQYPAHLTNAERMSQQSLDTPIASDIIPESNNIPMNVSLHDLSHRSLQDQTMYLLKILHQGVLIHPWIVMNPSLGKSFMGNALSAQEFYLQLSLSITEDMLNRLQKDGSEIQME